MDRGRVCLSCESGGTLDILEGAGKELVIRCVRRGGRGGAGGVWRWGPEDPQEYGRWIVNTDTAGDARVNCERVSRD